MFCLFGYEEAVRNVYRVSHPYLAGATISQTKQLRQFFLEFLSNHQPYMPVNYSEDPFLDDDDTESKLATAYATNNTLNDLRQSEMIGGQYPGSVKLAKIKFARDSLVELLESNDELSAVFGLVIHSIMIKPCNDLQGRASHGGSSSAALGAIWMTLTRQVSEADVMEMFVHELAHHLLFLDELNYKHFDYLEMGKESNYAYSAILNRMRPLDKVVHSVVVAVELCLARTTFLPAIGPQSIHPDTNKMIESIKTAYASMQQVPLIESIASPRIQLILDRCLSACSKIEAGISQKSLNPVNASLAASAKV